MFCLVAKNDSGSQAAVTHDALFDQWMHCKCDILFYVQWRESKLFANRFALHSFTQSSALKYVCRFPRQFIHCRR